MIKKLKALVVILLLSLTAFSQKDTNKESQVCLPASVARLVAQDLFRLDSLTEEHKTALFIISDIQEKVERLDSVISVKNNKIELYREELIINDQKLKLSGSRITELEESVTTLQRKNQNSQGWIRTLGGGLISTTTVLLTLLLLK